MQPSVDDLRFDILHHSGILQLFSCGVDVGITTLRLLGVPPLYAWLRQLLQGPKPGQDRVLYATALTQCTFYLLFQSLENIALLQEAVESWLQSFPSDDAAMEALREGQIWSGPVMSQWQILNHPQIQARGIVREVEYPDGTTIPTIASPYQFSETPVQVGRVPFAGEHNQEILEEYLGYSEERVQALVKEGVMFEGEQARELKSGDR